MLQIKSGITPKGTIFIRELSEQGKLLRKRVVKKEIQYDTKMSSKREGKCSQILKTDWNRGGGEQTLLFPPKKLNFFQALFYGLTNKKVIKNANNESLLVKEPVVLQKNTTDAFYDSYIKMIHDETGFANSAIDSEMCNLKTQLNISKKYKR